MDDQLDHGQPCSEIICEANKSPGVPQGRCIRQCCDLQRSTLGTAASTRKHHRRAICQSRRLRPVELNCSTRNQLNARWHQLGRSLGRKARSRATRVSTCSSQAINLPLQSWPLAYWPDGSIKWTGFATVLPSDFQGPITLSPGAPHPP